VRTAQQHYLRRGKIVTLTKLYVEGVLVCGAGDTSTSTGAGEGNRTLVVSLGSCRSTIELHPRTPHSMRLCTLLATVLRGQCDGK
jgi:hypothetical protein